ncbi:hypothetical protein LZ30DRAFT_691495 [Colletotrichum cereale]|nr:hypothetical protein LZ30DRAFT_691495 [Colletotrichum cereale]
MRLTLSHAVIFGLLVAIPFNNAYPHEGNLDRRNNALNLIASEITVDSTFGRNADEDIKRRYVLEAIHPRGIPRLGEKPTKKDPPKTSPGSKPGSSTGGNRGGAGNAPGTETAGKFADSNQEKARAKGEALSNDLDQAIFNNAAAPERKNLKSLGYTAASGDKFPIDKNANYLKGMGVEMENVKHWRGRSQYRGEEDNVSTRKVPILETITDSSQGVLFVKQSWKDRDQSPPKATWTDMVHDNWMNECGRRGHVPKSLKLIVRDNIQSHTTEDSNGIKLNTQKAIDDVFEMFSADKTKTLKIDAKSDNPDVKASYQLLSAQTHVARVLQWLKDRHNDLGDKKIDSLDVNHIDHEKSRMYGIVIVLA